MLTAFGLFSVTAGVICYALERKSSWYTFAFGCSCALSSIYGFLQGAWPFGLAEIVWAAVAFKKWLAERQDYRAKAKTVAS